MIATGAIKRARRRRLNRVLTVCATLVIGAGIAVVWVRVVQTLTESSHPPRITAPPGGLVWNGRVFTSSTQFKAYLTSRGFSYSRWRADHPTAFGGSAPTATTHKTKTTKTVKTTTKQPAKPKPKPKPVTHHVAAPTVSNTSKPRPLTATVLTFLLLIVGLVVGGSVLVPPRYAPVAVQRFYANPDRRMVALAAAAATLLGFGVSFFLA